VGWACTACMAYNTTTGMIPVSVRSGGDSAICPVNGVNKRGPKMGPLLDPLGPPRPPRPRISEVGMTWFCQLNRSGGIVMATGIILDNSTKEREGLSIVQSIVRLIRLGRNRAMKYSLGAWGLGVQGCLCPGPCSGNFKMDLPRTNI
jgi:hypothetical protein